MVKTKKIIYAKPFDGVPNEGNFQLIEEELPPIKNGEFLVEAIYLSVDPYMRAYSKRLNPGQTMIGCQIGKIIESKNKNYPVGKYVNGQFGWRTHTISDGHPPDITNYPIYVLPEEDVPLSLFLGILGRTGNTAYFGFLEICKPKTNETVVISGAGGAVGSHVGQIAKIKGCKVIGITGSDEKSKWLKGIGFDEVINYKTANLPDVLAQFTPSGIDCYFDNVGGEISSIVMRQMNRYGRVSICGSISSYNDKTPHKATYVQRTIISNELYLKGFIAKSFTDRWIEGIKQNLQWFRDGKLKPKETITDGFENTPKAFIGMLNGGNIGKALVKIN